MELQDSKLGRASVIGVKGRIDNSSAPLFQSHCETLLNKGEKFLILDFGDVEYLSSAGLRSILTLEKKLKPLNGKLILCSLKPTVQEIFDISGFTSIFTLCPTLENAASKVM
ncbi:MAG TPA: anti-sigma factor antagonist [Verrucomicrobia bacterium]|nr:MAG: hypothetical protein A2X46_13565 [Lentisphaerae bacterium GWF2_57_35]HBA86193.1 anti-sigma factor antagonist [Verrucomicrobiota bacterium]